MAARVGIPLILLAKLAIDRGCLIASGRERIPERSLHGFVCMQC